jgi:hypothetical protein
MLLVVVLHVVAHGDLERLAVPVADAKPGLVVALFRPVDQVSTDVDEDAREIVETRLCHTDDGSTEARAYRSLCA